MGSVSIDRGEHRGKPDAEIAEGIARKHGYVAVVRYKNSADASEFTNFGTCQTEEEIRGYLSSPHCHDAEIIYDGRATALRVTEDLILKGRCELCGKRASRASLQLMAGNDFYICPKCGLLCCDSCYVRLPLASSPGYGTCPKCRVEVQRALPGFYGKQSGSPLSYRPDTPQIEKANSAREAADGTSSAPLLYNRRGKRTAKGLGIFLATAGAVLFVAGPFLAHIGALPALGGFMMFDLGGFLGLIALVLGIIGAVRGAGFGRGLALGGAVTVVFLAIALPAGKFPPINDITTDTVNPPQFVSAAALPANQGRDMKYPGGTFTEQQRAGYPDLVPLPLALPVDEAFKRVETAAHSLPDTEITRVDPAAHAIEGTSTTYLFRFHDEFVVEVRTDGSGSVVQMRSKSRAGKGDIGANAARIKALFAKLG